MSEIVWIAIVVFGGVLLLPLISRLLSGKERLLRNIIVTLFILYILAILYETLLFRASAVHAKFKLSLFWSYRASIALYEEGKGFGFYIVNSRLLEQIILNILLYIPLGYLLPLALPQLTQTKRSASRPRAARRRTAFPWIVVLIGAAFSIAIEFTQLVFKLGLFEFDDIFNNTVGCLIGVILYQALARPRAQKTE